MHMSRNSVAPQEKPVIDEALFEVGLVMKDKLGPIPNDELLNKIAHMGESVVRLARKIYYLKETAKDLDDIFSLLEANTPEKSKVISVSDIAIPMGNSTIRLGLQRTEEEDISNTLRMQIGGEILGHGDTDTVLEFTRATATEDWQLQASKTDGSPNIPALLDKNLSEPEIIAIYGLATASSHVVEELHASEELEVKPELLPQ